MIARHAKLITVLIFAVLILILGLLVASVTSFSPVPDVSAQPIRPMPTAREDGTLHHPVNVDPSPFATPVNTWKVATVDGGHETWVLNWLYSARGGADYALHPGEYISFRKALYRVTAINRNALTMTVWGPLDCCA